MHEIYTPKNSSGLHVVSYRSKVRLQYSIVWPIHWITSQREVISSYTTTNFTHNIMRTYMCPPLPPWKVQLCVCITICCLNRIHMQVFFLQDTRQDRENLCERGWLGVEKVLEQQENNDNKAYCTKINVTCCRLNNVNTSGFKEILLSSPLWWKPMSWLCVYYFVCFMAILF